MAAEVKPEFKPFRFVDHADEIKRKIVCRNEEIESVLGLLGQTPFDEPPSSLFVYGDTGTGKSLILSTCLEFGRFRSAVVNCIEGYSMKIIYESIINQLANHEMNEDNSYQPYAKCNNSLEFVLQLQQVSNTFQFGKPQDDHVSIVIVLDKCEKLRKLSKNILVAFMKLRELSSLKICVIFVSTLPWTSFFIDDNALEPLTIYIEQYTQKQVCEVLQLYKPEGFSPEFYENYINLFLSIFYHTCHDIRELKHQAEVNFEHYSKPIKTGELSEKDANVLWKRSHPHFKKSLRSLYLKMDCDIEAAEKLTSVTTQTLNMELPFYSKYLLIGSYIASFNPASEDKRLFVKNHGKHKKSTRTKSEKVKHHLIGPKPFGLQRLYAIVSSILDDEKFNLNADLFIEVASLVRMNLLTQISEDNVDSPTYKCNVGLQFIDVIAKNVQFPIRNYLVDFRDS